MVQADQPEGEQRPYERLLRELTRAMEKVELAAALGQEAPDELEIKGLQASDVSLIEAYLSGERRWLSDWLDTVAEKPSHASDSGGNQNIHALDCAICGHTIACAAGHNRQPCPSCGSRLFLVTKPQ
jgi:DNA-directed RNA polymerase subunit RPC12/RpoP